MDWYIVLIVLGFFAILLEISHVKKTLDKSRSRSQDELRSHIDRKLNHIRNLYDDNSFVGNEHLGVTRALAEAMGYEVRDIMCDRPGLCRNGHMRLVKKSEVRKIPVRSIKDTKKA